MALTFLEMKTALKRYGFDDTDPLATWINASAHNINLAFDWAETQFLTTINTVASVNKIDLSTAVALPARVIGVRYAKMSLSDDILENIGQEEYFRTYATDTTKAIPKVFSMVGNRNMYLWPIPDIIYVVTTLLKLGLPTLSADGDVSILPEELHYTVVEGAAAIALSAENEEERSLAAQGRAQEGVDRAVSALNQRSKMPLRVYDAQGYFDS